MKTYKWTNFGMEPDVNGEWVLAKETINPMILTVKEQVDNIYTEQFNGHPSREEQAKTQKAIDFLADQIDKLWIKSRK